MFRSQLLLSLLILLFGCCRHPAEPEKVRLFLDTDLGPDYDDAGAMAIMHALADSGYVDILATVSSNRSERTVPCIEIINTYFQRPFIPVGVAKGADAITLECPHQKKWTEILPLTYKHSTQSSSQAPDAVKVYRSVLCEQPDSSVTICTIGSFTNLKNLLLSNGDEISPLTGKELIRKKVRHLVSMAGVFPKGREYNIYSDANSASTVIHNWPTEIVFCGFEIGYQIITGQQVRRMQAENNPIKDIYELSMSQGEPQGRWSWDQATIWAAIKGYSPHYTYERGIMRVDNNGTNEWHSINQGKHLKLVLLTPPEEMASLLEKYMMHQPAESIN